MRLFRALTEVEVIDKELARLHNLLLDIARADEVGKDVFPGIWGRIKLLEETLLQVARRNAGIVGE